MRKCIFIIGGYGLENPYYIVVQYYLCAHRSAFGIYRVKAAVETFRIVAVGDHRLVQRADPVLLKPVLVDTA